MKIYAIKEKDDTLGWLLYSEEAKKFYVELPDNADWIKTPMILDSFVKRGLHTVNSRFSLLWVQQRIIPSNRQNIRQILRDLGLQEYDEYELLIAGHGRCAQDDCYIEETESPKELEERFSHKVSGVSVLSDYRLDIALRNGNHIELDASHLGRVFTPIYQYFDTVHILPDGYGVGWGSRLEVLYSDMDGFIVNGYKFANRINPEDFEKYKEQGQELMYDR